MEINQAWIDEQRAVCNAATPGPWESKHYGRYEDHDECCIDLTDDNIEPSKYENADFIAAARTALPAALDALEASIQREAEKDAEIVRMTAERDAAARDLKWLSNEYKFCVTCKRDNGRGVLDCNDERCDSENHYEWRGLCALHGDEKGV